MIGGEKLPWGNGVKLSVKRSLSWVKHRYRFNAVISAPDWPAFTSLVLSNRLESRASRPHTIAMTRQHCFIRDAQGVTLILTPFKHGAIVAATGRSAVGCMSASEMHANLPPIFNRGFQIVRCLASSAGSGSQRSGSTSLRPSNCWKLSTIQATEICSWTWGAREIS